MAAKVIFENRKNGIYYTPTPLAEFLVRPLINRPNLSVFDPAYGEGVLLLTAEKLFKEYVGSGGGSINLFGCDKAPINGSLSHLPSANLLELDFFEYPLENKFDIILMNPPYVRHHTIGKEKIKAYQDLTSDKCNLNYASDLWAYFLVKSVGHLKKGGSIGAILPWSFLQADYACNLRSWLSDIFGEIKVLALGAKYFDKAKERVILLWLKNYGETCRTIKIAFAKHIEEGLSYVDLKLENWKSDKVNFNENYDTEFILSRYIEEFGFSKFENYADVRIGVVTGADVYFIVSETVAKGLGFSDEHLISIFTTSKEFSGLFHSGNNQLKRLIVISECNYENFKNYIKKGKDRHYHLRSHSLRRKPWYAVNIGEAPDAFFPYRMSNLPYLVRNDRKTQCTNSIHRIYFKNLSEIEVRWIQISLMSVVGQLSLESVSKTYGRGMLKIEPNSLKKSLVYKDNDPGINSIYFHISEQLSSGSKFQAMKMATEFIDNKLGISEDLSKSAEQALLELQNRRLSR